jgi:hypothetical protein
MKSFSEFEKKALRKVVKFDKITDFINVNSFLNDVVEIKSQVMIVGHEYDYELEEGENHYYKIEIKGNREDAPSDYLIIRKKFIELYYLLTYLIEYGLMLQIEGSKFRGLMINLQDFDQTDEIEIQEMYISETLKQLLELCSYTFQPTEELKELVRYNFVSREERNNRKTRNIAVVAIIILILGILFNTFFNIFESKHPNTDNIRNGIQIDTNSINYYIKKLNASKNNNTQIDSNSINNYKKEIDSAKIEGTKTDSSKLNRIKQ